MNVKHLGLLLLFAEVKELLDSHAACLTVRKDEPGYFDLWSERTCDGRPAAQGRVLLERLATLKRESCFHLRRMTPQLKERVAAALAAGWQHGQDP